MWDARATYGIPSTPFGRGRLVGNGFQLGARDRPVAADMDQDGITDIGLYVPDGSGATGMSASEWYWLVSNDPATDTSGKPLVQLRTPGTVNVLALRAASPFAPFVPSLGGNLYADFGNTYQEPVVGNFDPPIVPGATPTATGVPLALSVAPLVTNSRSTLTLTGTAVDPSPNIGIASVTVLVNGQATIATVSGDTWSATLAAPPAGTYTVQATAFDNAGNSGTVSATGALVVNAGTTLSLSGTTFSFTGGLTPATWKILVNGSHGDEHSRHDHGGQLHRHRRQREGGHYRRFGQRGIRRNRPGPGHV